MHIEYLWFNGFCPVCFSCRGTFAWREACLTCYAQHILRSFQLTLAVLGFFWLCNLLIMASFYILDATKTKSITQSLPVLGYNDKRHRDSHSAWLKVLQELSSRAHCPEICPQSLWEAPVPHFLSLMEQSTAMMFCISVIFTSSCGISTSIGIFSSSSIFSAEELRLDSLPISSSSSEMRSATQWAVRRASGSWSQHSLMVAHITAMPCRGSQRARISDKGKRHSKKLELKSLMVVEVKVSGELKLLLTGDSVHAVLISQCPLKWKLT